MHAFYRLRISRSRWLIRDVRCLPMQPVRYIQEEHRKGVNVLGPRLRTRPYVLMAKRVLWLGALGRCRYEGHGCPRQATVQAAHVGLPALSQLPLRQGAGHRRWAARLWLVLSAEKTGSAIYPC